MYTGWYNEHREKHCTYNRPSIDHISVECKQQIYYNILVINNHSRKDKSMPISYGIASLVVANYIANKNHKEPILLTKCSFRINKTETVDIMIAS